MSDTKKAGSVAVSNNKAMIFLKENLGIIIALLILCVFLSVFPGTSESFPTVRNVFNVLRQISSNLLLACGMTMVIILGGIYAGWFTPTEAAVVAIFYTLLVGLFIHRELKLRSIMASLKTTSWLSGRVLVLVFTATSFGYLMTSYRIPNDIATMVLSLTDNVYVVWVFVVVLLVFLGMFMETLAIIMLVTPVLLPIMTSYGVDPIHFGLVLICCCGIGFSTPPLGENMFIASGISNQSVEAISLKAIPMVISNLCAIVLLVIFPDLVLWLPSMMDAAAP